MRKLAILFVGLTFLISCGDKKKDQPGGEQTEEEVVVPVGDGPEAYDPKRGEGKYDKVDLDPTLNKDLADKGKSVSEVKCLSCHKTTDEKLVGPGWKGVTERRAPQWIMNFITNPDPMIDKDPEVQAQLELCLVRMPNQGLSDDEARNILEYMRSIDGVK